MLLFSSVLVAPSVSFTNGVVLYEGQTHGGRNEEVMRVQIRETVREHFEKELRIRRTMAEGGRLKVLSLFFIDRVANYWPDDGKIRKWFEALQTGRLPIGLFKGLERRGPAQPGRG